MYTILIVEDDERIADKLRSAISKYDFNVRITEDFSRVIDIFADTKPDLVLLDVNLPKFDGFYWCRQIRTQSHCPIIFISARDSGMDQIMALENGADDYITKPFDMELVLAKIRDHLRRAVGAYASGQEDEHTIESAGLIIYPERYVVTYGDESAELTQRKRPADDADGKRGPCGQPRAALDLMWEDQHFIDDNTLNVYITRVRRKLRELGAGDLIETVRGAGYRFMTGRETP